MDNFTSNNSGRYEYQIKLRKAKLEKMRKEREILQFEKLKRENSKQENLEENLIKKEAHKKAIKINHAEIDQIWKEINVLNEYTNNVPTAVISPHTNENKMSKIVNLRCSNLQITEIPPIETVTYSKNTQTEMSGLCMQNIEAKYGCDNKEYGVDDYDVVPHLKMFCSFSSNLPPGILSPGLPNVMDILPALTPIDIENPWTYFKEKTKTNLQDQNEELFSQDFQRSLNRVGLGIESVLKNNKNICVDYINGPGSYKTINENSSMALLNLSHVFCNKGLARKRRCITCIDWSPHCPDQIAVSYYKHEESSFNTEEDVIIWNQNFKQQTPQQVFHCHSSVLSLSFTKFSPNLIMGATYSGQIVLWDNRIKTSIPVQSTKLNCKAHTQPIYCLREIGCESSHNIMSISSDGKLCCWNLDMLAQPVDIMQLQLDVSDKIKKPISVTCMDFPANGVNNLVLGGEDGHAYSAFRYGFDSGINNRYIKHEAPITSISSHYNETSIAFGNLFLTSSMDCTIKLWSIERSNSLITFKNNDDYVMDVSWSPVHPAIFISVDGSGCIDLYNLNENLEGPIKSIKIKEGTAINRVAWNCNGQDVAFGTEYGELYLYKTTKALANPKSDEWNNFNQTLYDITDNCGVEFYD